MGKKRKGAGRPYGSGNNTNDESGKLALNSWEDVADSEDEFHLNRDKILLDEGPDAKRRRKQEEEEEAFLEQSDEEVLGYDDESSGQDADDYQDYEEEEDEQKIDGTFKAKRKSTAAQDEEEEEDLAGWGPSKSDYYNADAIETEQDALNEEKEALRIQKLQLQRMSAADFGLDDEEEDGSDGVVADSDEEEEEEQVVTEVLPQPRLPKDAKPEQRLKVLQERYPEFEHLRKDLLELHPRASELKLLAQAILRTRSKPELAQRQPIAVVKWRAVTAYLGSVSMYLALLTSTHSSADPEMITAMHPQNLHNHPVMESLLKCREIWNQVKDLPVDNMDATDLSVIEEELGDSVIPSGPSLEDETESKAVSRPKASKSKTQRRAEMLQAERRALQAEKNRQLEEELAQLSHLTNTQPIRGESSKRTDLPLTKFVDDDSDLGEETRLNEDALEEKAKRKRSLKFYTSQITQKANKRTAAGKDYGGDVDVPHKERLRDRQQRLNAEAERRGRKSQGADEELGGESDEEDYRQAREIRDGAGGDSDDMYEQVLSRNKKRKLDKQEAAEAHALAKAQGGYVVEEESIGPDSKRKITYLIEKNKGLTPHRKKEVRNPRLKKRLAYESKKKKLKSIRAVYSGGEGKGGYSGEKTGIKKGLVKSIKL